MKNLTLIALLILGSVSIFGCSSSESDLTNKDKQDMDKLFREGIKNPPSNTAAPAGNQAAPQSKPLNTPTD